MPEGITSIGDDAFYFCENLKKIIIPKTVEFIGKDAFACCDELNIYGEIGSYAEMYVRNLQKDETEDIDFHSNKKVYRKLT